MGSISGSKKLKRQMAPLFWNIGRKDKRFVVTVRPGPHSKSLSVPTSVFLRDMIKIVTSLREAKAAIYTGKMKVDGVVRKSLHHGIGLMDVVELENVKDVYRLVPQDGRILRPIKIKQDERTKKIVRVKSKVSIKGNKIQIGFHDGRSLITDTDVNVGDSCLIQIPDVKILDVMKLEKGTHVMVTSGINAGQIGTIEEIENGTFILPRKAIVSLETRKIEIPTDLLMVVGKGAPAIQIK